MLQTKRAKRESRKKRLILSFIFLLYIATIIFLGIFVVYSHFFQKYSLLIPIVQEKNILNLDFLLRNKNIEFESIKKIDDYFLIKQAGNKVIYFSAQADLQKQVTSLQLVLNRLTIEGKGFKRLDFRYDTPVIVF